MRYLSVCAGICAASVAWAPIGWTPAGFAEIDDFPRAVLQQRHGAQPVDFATHRYDPKSNITPLFGDFTKIEAHHVGPVDVLVGGTPCQSFSVAGKRLGLDDPRGNLAIEFMALARRLGARWVVWENVPGVLSSWSRVEGSETGLDPASGASRGSQIWTETGDFAAFLELFRECGYSGCYRVLDAQYVRVDGFERAVPQRRRRVFLVGHLGDGRARSVLFDADSVRGTPAPRREAGQDIAFDTAGSLVGSGGGRGTYRSQRRGRVISAARMTAIGEYAEDGTASTLKHRDYKDATDLVAITPPVTFPGNMSGTQCVGSDGETSITLQSKNPTAVAFSNRNNGADADSEVAPTVTGMSGGESNAPAGGNIRVAVPFDTTQLTHPANRSNPKDGDPCHALAASAHVPAIAFQERGRPEGKTIETSIDVAYALTAGAGGGRHNENRIAFAWQPRISRNGRGQPEFIAPALNGADAGATSDMRPAVGVTYGSGWCVRRLTPRECERLQGFPDDFTLVHYRGGPAADTPRFKAIGNSMAVNVMRWIGERIEYVEQLMMERSA